MPGVVLLSAAQMRRIEPFFLRSRGLPRVDDRSVPSSRRSSVLLPRPFGPSTASTSPAPVSEGDLTEPQERLSRRPSLGGVTIG